MTLFDRYIAVDWSAANTPRTDKDSIWIGEIAGSAQRPSLNPATRGEAMSLIADRLRDARESDQRVLVGFDFAFGYPRGTARAIAGEARWYALWTAIADRVADQDNNRSNRFEAAAGFNRAIGEEHFWGHPPHHRYVDLHDLKPPHKYARLPEYRLVETQARGAQPVWKLNGAGSVGSQSLLGIARLQALRRDVQDIAVWPFETDFERELGPITIAEIYPSLFPLRGQAVPRDREQVETVVQYFAALDAGGKLAEFLSAPAELSMQQRQMVLEEEGWIAGVGHETLIAETRLPRTYLRDPEAIYAQSFSTIRTEAHLGGLSEDMRDVAVRMIHACGLIEIAPHIRASEDVVEKVEFALVEKAPIFCDAEATKAGISHRYLKGNEVICTLNDPAVPALAQKLGTTRSAAALELRRDRLGGAIVVIGNAPTALFHLLDMLDTGGPRPAAIIATPVGIVGAEDAKAELALDVHEVPFITLLGRWGGSAIAAAALNAIARGLER